MNKSFLLKHLKRLGQSSVFTHYSSTYNFVFNYLDGSMQRWGTTFEDDPSFSPVGNEILDIEVSTICSGINGSPCSFCYKGNTSIGINMSFETFKYVLDTFILNSKVLTQLAFGIGDIDGNPDLIKMLDYCYSNPYRVVIPNITINGSMLTSQYIDMLKYYCGAIAVSHYDTNLCFNSVCKLADKDTQVNIHQVLAEETYSKSIDLLKRISENKDMSCLNAVVFLLLKPKGSRNTLTPLLDKTKYKNLLTLAEDLDISCGFDSCSSSIVLPLLNKEQAIFVEPCESTLFSLYVNVDGYVYPCSFCEDELNIEKEDITTNFWSSPGIIDFRSKLLNCQRNCPQFPLKGV